MNIDVIRNYCLGKKGVTESFPFDEDTLVFKVMGKMFALVSVGKWERGEKSINLKCDPDYAGELRAEYESIIPGYHMSKKHWNTVLVSAGELKADFIKLLIDHSYNLVVAGLPKQTRNLLE